MTVELTKEQQQRLIQANKIFKLRMIKDSFTEEQAELFEVGLEDIFPFVMRVQTPSDFDTNGQYKWIVGG